MGPDYVHYQTFSNQKDLFSLRQMMKKTNFVSLMMDNKKILST